MVHLVNLHHDDGFTLVPTVTHAVGLKSGKAPGDVALVNTLLNIVYSHRPPLDIPPPSRTPQFTTTTDRYIQHFQLEGGLKDDGIVSAIPLSMTYRNAIKYFTCGKLYWHALTWMSFDLPIEMDAEAELLAFLKKQPGLHSLGSVIYQPAGATSEGGGQAEVPVVRL